MDKEDIYKTIWFIIIGIVGLASLLLTLLMLIFVGNSIEQKFNFIDYQLKKERVEFLKTINEQAKNGNISYAAINELNHILYPEIKKKH